jgi:leucyl aminopeptidase
VLGPAATAVDAALGGGRLVAVLGQLGATGSAGEVTKLATLGATVAPVVAAVGMGKAGEGADGPDAPGAVESARRAAGAAIRALAGTARVGVALSADDPATLRGVAEGAALGAYDFTAFRSELPDGYKAPVHAVTLLSADPAAPAEASRAEVLARAAVLARDWINTPPNALRPPEFADAARAAALDAGLDVEVLDPAALRDGGYGGILAVGGGSAAGPRLVRIAYRPAGEDAHRRVALVGKGITFDSGGISIKPFQGMHEMKSDMSGAANVVAAMTAVAALRPPVAVTAWVPIAENLPSGSAYRPGDVLTMRGGTRVEVLNTDAEGRLVLADAIARACEDSPDYLVETSTLTGGHVIALGHRVTGVMGSPELCERVKAAGDRTGEPMWPMPMPEDVTSGLDSPIADLSQINNGYDRAGHMLQGGVFLSRFVADGVQWVHLDIAGTAYNGKAPFGYVHKGGTAVPLRTLVELVEDIAVRG